MKNKILGINNAMKGLKIYLLVCLVALLLSGCSRALPLARVERDEELTGGNLSFKIEGDKIYLGGKDQCLQFYEANIAKGWAEAGNRVGLVFYAPSKIEDFDTGTLVFQGKTIQGGEFYQTVNGQKTGKVTLYPLFTSEKRTAEIKITWQDGTAEQTYQVIIDDQTSFMGN